METSEFALSPRRSLHMRVSSTVVEEGKALEVSFQVPCTHIPMFPREKRRVCIAAVDIGLAVQMRQLDPGDIVRSKMISSLYLCGRWSSEEQGEAALAPAVYRFSLKPKQRSVLMNLVPLQETDCAQVAICLVVESNILGSSAWIFKDSIKVLVHRPGVPVKAVEGTEDVRSQASPSFRKKTVRLFWNL